MCLSKIILTDSNLFFYLYAFLGNPQLLIITLFCLNNNQRGEIVAYQKVWFAPVEADSSKIIFNFLFLKKIAAFGRMLYVPPFLGGQPLVPDICIGSQPVFLYSYNPPGINFMAPLLSRLGDV